MRNVRFEWQLSATVDCSVTELSKWLVMIGGNIDIICL